MWTRFYRVLLTALPRKRRRQFGTEMVAVFGELQDRARETGGPTAVLMLSLREAWGIVRFAWREWRESLGRQLWRPTGRGPRIGTELRWAWRGLRARGGAGLLSGSLLAIVLAVNTLVFAATDSLVFRSLPYPDPDRIVTMTPRVDQPESLPWPVVANLLERWREERDTVVHVGGYLRKGGVFLTGSAYEQVATADLTLGVLEVLGAKPRWGRAFRADDLRDGSVLPALMSERLARRRFVSPERALGQRVEATGLPLVVVGVMSDEFAFPNASYQLWRGIEPAGPMTSDFGGLLMLARLARHLRPQDGTAALDTAARRIGLSAGLTTYRVDTQPYSSSPTPRSTPSQHRTVMLVLSGAALCLLLVACANIASIELAHTLRRARSLALHAALGASRARAARLVALEGLLLIGGALSAGLLLTSLLAPALVDALPTSVANRTENPIGLDARAIWFTSLAACLCWAVAVLPALLASARPRLLTFLALEGRTSVSSRGSTRFRQLLTLVQVTVAVMLVVGGLLHVRTYRELLRLDKGFDATGLATVTMTMPSDVLASRAERTAVTDRLLEELRRLPGVVAASSSGAPPSTGDSPSKVTLEVDGRPVPEPLLLGRKWVDAAYFDVTRLPLREGRYLQPGDAETDVVASETFARRLWPDSSGVGRTFRDVNAGWFQTPHRIVGVVGDFRTAPRRMPGADDSNFYVYALVPTAPVAAPNRRPSPPAARPVDSGGSFRFLDIMVRVESPAVLPLVHSAIQRIDPRMLTRSRFVDELYAEQHADILLATRVISGFGIVAFLTAMAGLYGVMSFLVASRTREIGIRMALGATARDVSRMVLASSGRLVVAGAILGLLTAVWASKWIEAQLFGVSPTDPWTYLGVATAVIATAGLATWRPAYQAARTNPAVTLRAE